MNASSGTLNYGFRILQLAKQKRVTNGRSPRVLAANALYIAQFQRLGPISEKWTKKQVADAAGLCEATIRRNYRLFMDKLGLDLEPAE